MLTFFTVLFALLLGLVVGVILGAACMSFGLLSSKSAREYFEKEAFDEDPICEIEEL